MRLILNFLTIIIDLPLFGYINGLTTFSLNFFKLKISVKRN